MAFLVATTTLYYLSLWLVYDEPGLPLLGSGGNVATVISSVEVVTKLITTNALLWWFVVFPVKLAFLVCFHRLIDRALAYRLRLFWWFVTVSLVCSSSMRVLWVR